MPYTCKNISVESSMDLFSDSNKVFFEQQCMPTALQETI